VRRAKTAAINASRRSSVSNRAPERCRGTPCSPDFRQKQQPLMRSQTKRVVCRLIGGNGSVNSSQYSDLPQPLFIGIGKEKSSFISAGRAHEFISIAR
jgi:hypothetical protein